MASGRTPIPYLRQHIGAPGINRQSLLTALLFVTMLMLVPGAARAQTGTLTDDAYTSPNLRIQSDF
jgi:hypothetical protein